MQRFLSSALILAFLVSDARVYAQGVVKLPVPGTRLELSPIFVPPLLKGIKVYRNEPFRFDFILDKGDEKGPARTSDGLHVGDGPNAIPLRDDANRLIKYFLAALTIPEKDLWVNLSPYEKDRIVPEAFGQTEMGRDLLAQDYILKQITASLIYPEGDVGKQFWAKVYAAAQAKFGTTDIPVDTFNKVWIIPEKATVYENKDAAFVVESRLKVMLESDYLAESNNVVRTYDLAKDILREVVIPILEKEVNEGKSFAPLRQVYNSLILATWYKRKIKASIMGQAYVDKQKTGGIDIADKNEKEKIWSLYVESFKKGAYNLIKEEVDPKTHTTVPRKYFSGGADMAQIGEIYAVADTAALLTNAVLDHAEVIEVKVDPSEPRGVSITDALEQVSQGRTDRIKTLESILLQRQIKAGLPAEIFTVDFGSVIQRNIFLTPIVNEFNKIANAMREGRILKINLGPMQKEDYEEILLKIMVFANFINEHVVRQEKGSIAIRHTIKELLKNAFVHGNRLNLSLPMYLRFDLRQGVLEVFDTANNKPINKAKLQKSSEWLHGGGIGLEEIKSHPGVHFIDPTSIMAHGASSDIVVGTVVRVEFDTTTLIIKEQTKSDLHDSAEKGGIDLNPSKISITTKKQGEEMEFNIDPVMLQRIKDASGVTPVIIGIHPLNNSLQEFFEIPPLT